MLQKDFKISGYSSAGNMGSGYCNEATSGKDIVCKAAVAWGPKEPLDLVDVKVAAPKAGEVLF